MCNAPGSPTSHLSHFFKKKKKFYANDSNLICKCQAGDGRDRSISDADRSKIQFLNLKKKKKKIRFFVRKTLANSRSWIFMSDVKANCSRSRLMALATFHPFQFLTPTDTSSDAVKRRPSPTGGTCFNEWMNNTWPSDHVHIIQILRQRRLLTNT